MKNIHLVITCIIALFITACNTTPKTAKLTKKPLVSDHHLLMSLINRPVTADQQIMLAFEKQRESNYNDIFVNAVSIKGPKLIDNSEPLYFYNHIINNDVNAVSIQGETLKANKS